MARANATTDHDKIREWAETRGGHPATVKRTERGKEAGILRLDFDPPDESLEKISWDDFFEKFEDADLAFLYQDKTAAGKQSRFHKFVSRDSVDADDENSDEDEDEDEDDEDDEEVVEDDEDDDEDDDDED
jgi:hypothetical protein